MKPYYQDDQVTLYHGDCRLLTEWLTADVLVTDPPYGLQVLAGAYGRGHKTIQNDGDTSLRDYALREWGRRPAAVFSTPRMAEPPGEWSHRLVWDKAEPGLNGGPWRYNHELIFVRGQGWKRTNANAFSIMRHPAGNGSSDRDVHPHRKPVDLLRRIISAAPDGVIADPFSGSGSTLRAAKDLGRKAIGVELEEQYCEAIVKRLAQESLGLGGVA